MSSAISAASTLPLSRRTFLHASATAAGGLMVALYLDLPSMARERSQVKPQMYRPDAFIQIQPDGKIVIQVNRLEFGQGVQTALPMLLADEMDADWPQVVAELAPAADVYRDPIRGMQLVGGSGSIATSFQQYRELGARARAMLVAAAADRWKIPADRCRTEASVVRGPSGEKATYAELAGDASRLPIPTTVQLKSPADFRLVGKRVPRLDTPQVRRLAEVRTRRRSARHAGRSGRGAAVFGASVKSLDDKAARSIPGVTDIFQIPTISKGTGVAVVADKFWTAKQARDRLQIDWDLATVEHADSSQLREEFRKLVRTPGNVAVARGDAKALDGIAAANRIIVRIRIPLSGPCADGTVEYDGAVRRRPRRSLGGLTVSDG